MFPAPQGSTGPEVTSWPSGHSVTFARQQGYRRDGLIAMIEAVAALTGRQPRRQT